MRRRGPRLWRLTLRGLAVSVCALPLLLVPAIPTSAEGPLNKQVEEWFESVQPDGTIRVRNAFGNVHARFGGYEGQAEILATTQRLEDEAPELRVERLSVEKGLNVTVDFALAEGEARPADDATRDRVDLVLFVPRGVRLDIETEDGLIAVKKLKSDVVASSRTGDLQIKSVNGNVQAKTVHGRIEATLETGATADAQTFSTVTGDIEIWVWEDARSDVQMATSGEISTDFSIQIEHRRFEEPSKFATATLGGGGPELSLHSKKGRVKLLRLQKNFRPE